MTGQEAKTIIALQKHGYGYKRISAETGIPINTVKSFCRRHATETAEVQDTFCLCCGNPLQHTPHKKKKKFCSDACRMKWWNSHQDQVQRKAYYTYTCKYCGRKFTAYGNSHRSYCSKACAIAGRAKENANG